jgi:hypothetical protein
MPEPRTKMGSYEDGTETIWCECARHGTFETPSMHIAEAWARLHDYCVRPAVPHLPREDDGQPS